jgi:hypothetical protein
MADQLRVLLSASRPLASAVTRIYAIRNPHKLTGLDREAVLSR